MFTRGNRKKSWWKNVFNWIENRLKIIHPHIHILQSDMYSKSLHQDQLHHDGVHFTLTHQHSPWQIRGLVRDWSVEMREARVFIQCTPWFLLAFLHSFLPTSWCLEVAFTVLKIIPVQFNMSYNVCANSWCCNQSWHTTRPSLKCKNFFPLLS